MQFNASFGGSDAEVINYYRTLYNKIMASLEAGMDTEMLRLRHYIVTQKLSGQVLRHVSGTLVDSIHPVKSVVKGNQVIGGIEGGGGPAHYGGYFEAGGKGPYIIRPVNKKALAFFGADGSTPRNQSVMGNVRRAMASGGNRRAAAISSFSSIGGVVTKQVTHPAIPHLPFMGPSLEENAGSIRDALQKVVSEAIRR